MFWVKIIDELESSKREFAAEDCWLLELKKGVRKKDQYVGVYIVTVVFCLPQARDHHFAQIMAHDS